MRKIIFYNLLIIIALGSCKKVDLAPTFSGDPVFSVKATLGNDSLKLFAGDNNVYMFSEFSKDSLDVYTMTGRFAKDTSCQNECEESLSFSIRSSYATPSVSDFVFEDAILENVFLPFFTLEDSIEVNGFSYFFNGELVDSLSGSSAASSIWEITEGNNLAATYIGDSIIHDYFGTEDLRVRLKINTTSGCESYIETIVPNGSNAPNFCNLFIDLDFDSAGNLLLVPIFGNSIFNTFIWNGDSTINTPFETNPNTIDVALQASNSDCNVSMGICTFSQGMMTSAFPQFEVNVQGITKFEMINLGEQFSTITIEYQDSTGIYSSKFADNSNPNNTFTITKIENYEDNENGEKTKKLTIDYNCILEKEGSGETKNISGTAEIAVAYPD